MEAEDSDSGPSTPKKSAAGVFKYKRRKQKYRKIWETDSQFKGWLCADESDPERAQCRVCNATFVSELGCVKKHAKSEHHIKKMKGVSSKSQAILSTFVKSASTDTSLNNQAHIAEIKLAGFVAEHNLPFNVVNHLEEVIKSSFTDSKIADAIHLRRTKCVQIVKNVIGQSHKNELAEKLRHTKFSVLTDDSTDVGSIKTSCVVVRYFDKDTNKIESKFWNLCEIFKPGEYDKANKGATSENLYTNLMLSFSEYNVPENNIVGFASDGCNSLMGPRNSVATRLLEKCPGLIIIKCICHSLHICASEACKCLPRRCEDLARNIYNHFKASAKRQAQLHEFQSFLDIKIHKMLHPSQTRWLSLRAVVVRILEQWTALRLYFDSKYLEERLLAVEEIHRALNDKFLKLFYIYLAYILPKFTDLNKYFQSGKAVIIDLHEKMVDGYKEILLCYMDRQYVVTNKLIDIDPNNRSKYLPDTQMYLGVEVLKEMQKPEIYNERDAVKDFYRRCRDFMQTGCSEIKKRYNFGDELLPLFAVLKPTRALSNKEREMTPSLIPLMSKLPRIVPLEDNNRLQQIDDDWRKLPIVKIDENVKNCSEVDVFWGNILNLKTSCGEREFPALPEFALSCLSLPHSNADCERIFSKMNLIKVKNRNRLVTSTVNGCLLASQCVRSNGSCKDFVPTAKMLSSMKKTQLYSQPSTSSSSVPDPPEEEEEEDEDDAFHF